MASLVALLALLHALGGAADEGACAAEAADEGSLLQTRPQVALGPRRPLGSIDCSGQPFTVSQGDYCFAYGQECPSMAFLCCRDAGQTCTAAVTDIYAGDVCTVSTGVACGSPSPTPSPTVAPGLVGNWIKTWSPAQLTPAPSMSICFSGEVDAQAALQTCLGAPLTGERWLSIGGGNCDSSDGRDVSWTTQRVQQVIDKANARAFSDYAGVMFDLETDGRGCSLGGSVCGAGLGPYAYGDSPSAAKFEEAYAALKGQGLKVAVSWSYSFPYCMYNAKEVTASALRSASLDLVSPQMYGGGGQFSAQTYSPADFNGRCTLTYADYSGAKGAIVPSYTLTNHQTDTARNLANLEQQQADMLAWAGRNGFATFGASPGCLAYQDE